LGLNTRAPSSCTGAPACGIRNRAYTKTEFTTKGSKSTKGGEKSKSFRVRLLKSVFTMRSLKVIDRELSRFFFVLFVSFVVIEIILPVMILL
jgi:hypothetical protein